LQDASDLFGADLPVEGGVGGQFAWRDGPFLQALKAGDWIVLDEVCRYFFTKRQDLNFIKISA
jgi:midasin (ATPase involved in ribosome maturation)